MIAVADHATSVVDAKARKMENLYRNDGTALEMWLECHAGCAFPAQCEMECESWLR